MSRSARFDEQSFSAAQSKKARKLRRRKRELDDDEEDREVLPRWKIIAVFAAIGICFAMLFPSLFAPLLSSMFGWKRGAEPQQTAQPHHPYMQSNGPPRPGGPSRPMPGRMPQPEIPQSGRGGMFSWMLPIYTVGVMGFLIYTLVKMNRRKKKRRNRYEDDIDEMDVSSSNSDDEDDSDRDGLGHRNLRSIQSRLRETESAMAKILEQLEEIAQAAPNGGFDSAELMANYPPDKLRETERNLQELNRLNELRTKQQREIAEKLGDIDAEDMDDEQDIEEKHPTYAEVVATKQGSEEKSINRPLHEDGTPLSYAEVVAPKSEGTENNQSTQHVAHKLPLHSDGTPLTFAEVVADKPIETPNKELNGESVVYTYANAADPTIPPSRVFKRAKRKRPYDEGEARKPGAEDARKFEEQRKIVKSLAAQKTQEQPSIDDSEFPPLVSNVPNDETEISNESAEVDHEEVIESPLMDPEEFPPLPHVEKPEDQNEEVQQTEEVIIEEPILSSEEFPPLPPAADPPVLHHEGEQTKTEESILDPEQFPPLSNEETEEGESPTQKPSQKSKRSNNKNRRQRARREN
ncbi:Resistance to inhibitors of cholinesterase protein 3.1 [Aphelenchoides besseyi]|nr:Resistance to inhibitors of cholinesterase protein 3.1 [Aphelenchoides besseyi]